MNVSTPAIVLRSIDFKESSKIVTLLTPEHGKVGVMVRGARKLKSKFSGYFEVSNVLDVQLIIKQSRSVQNITEVSYRYKNFATRQDFERLSNAIATVELIDCLIHENEAAGELYYTAEKILCWLNESDVPLTLVFPYIQIRLADVSGIGLQLSHGQSLNEFQMDNKTVYLNVEDGMISDEAGTGLVFKLTPAQKNYLLGALQSRSSDIFRNAISKNDIKLLIHHLDVYFKHHIDGFRDRRSDHIFEQLLA